MSKSTYLKPRISEKAYGMSQTTSVYVFEVPGNENKHTVAAAVSAQFDVTVTGVNMLNQTGKNKRIYRKRSKQTTGKRPDIKKAYVTLKKGDSIPIFASEEDKKPEKPTKGARK